MLYGSCIFPGLVRIKWDEVQLGDIVRRAFADSGLTTEQWNNLSERDREHKLVDAFYDMRSER